jgi:hypothetical protein
MSWNIQKPGDYINGPLTVVGAVTLNSTLTVSGVSVFNNNVGIGIATPNVNANRSTLTLQGAWGGQLDINVGATNHAQFGSDNFNTGISCRIQSADGIIFRTNGGATEGGRFTTTGQFGIGATAWGGLRFAIGNTSDTGAATNGFAIYSNRAALTLFCNGATDAAGSTLNYSWANGGQGPFIIANASGEAARFNSTGTFVLGGGNAAANGRGVAFPAAQSASTDANTLDDYEEGTWTPTLTFATPGTLSATYGVRTGRYTKVGNLVTINAKVEFGPGGFVKGTATGTMILSGLPFAPANSLQLYADFAASLADQSAGSLMFFTNPGGVANLFSESVSVSGTRVIRDFAAITQNNFAASNAGFMSLPITFSYYV